MPSCRVGLSWVDYIASEMADLRHWFNIITLGGKLEGVSMCQMSKIMKLMLVSCSEFELESAIRDCCTEILTLRDDYRFNCYQVSSVHSYLSSRARKLDTNELAECLRLVEARRSSMKKPGNRITRPDFELLNKVVNKAALSNTELALVFGSSNTPENDIDILSSKLLGLID